MSSYLNKECVLVVEHVRVDIMRDELLRGLVLTWHYGQEKVYHLTGTEGGQFKKTNQLNNKIG